MLTCAPWAVVLSMLSAISYAFFTTLSTTLLADLLEQAKDIGHPEASKNILIFAGIYMGILLLRRMINVISDISFNIGIEEKCRHYFKMKIHGKVAKLPYISFEDSEVLNKIQRSNGCVESFQITDVFNNILMVMECLFTMIGLVLVMISFSYWYLPILVITTCPYLINRIYMGKEFYQLHWFQASKIRKRDYFYSIFTSRKSQRELRVFGFEDYIKGKWEKERDGVEQEVCEYRRKDSRRLCLCEGIVTLGYVISILLSVLLLINQSIAFGVFGASIFAFQSLQQSTKTLFLLLGSSFGSLHNIGDYFEFLNLQDEEGKEANLPDFTQGIELKQVVFSYPNTISPALQVESLQIKAGEKVIIVGENGSGKSTLSKLILGLYNPECGHVTYDGIDVNTIATKDLSKLVTAVSQNFVQFHLSLRQSMGINNPKEDGNEEKIKQVLCEVGLEVLCEDSDFDQYLGVEFGGRELSGGQWQKLSIARALFKEHKIIVLDEPTSALDPTTEHEILSQFIAMMEDKTSIIISHRVGLCNHVDKVVFMKQGTIGGIGTHVELMRKNKDYHQFYTEQAKWYYN